MQDLMRFHSPRKLHPIGYFVSIVKVLFSFIKTFLFFLVFLISKYYDRLNFQYIALIFGILFIVVCIVAYLKYKNFFYYIDEDKKEFVVNEGTFSKSKTVIKLDNILQVNITQNLLQRALSLYSLTLETSGTSDLEVDLFALDGDTASSLKAYLLQNITAQNLSEDIITKSKEQEVKENKLIHLSTKNMLLVSLFSNYRQGLILFFTFLAFLYDTISDIYESLNLKSPEHDIYAEVESKIGEYSFILLVGLVCVILIPFVINVFRYFIKYYDFFILRTKENNLSMQYGLTKRVNTIFNRDKIQTISFKQNRILKSLGLGILTLKQIVLDEQKASKSSIEFPGVTQEDRQTIYNLAFGEDVYKEAKTFYPKIGFLVSSLIKIGILCSVLLFITYFVDLGIDKFYLYIVVGLVLLMSVIYSILDFRRHSLKWNGEYLIQYNGVWNKKEVIIPVKKIQKIAVSQTFFQKRKATGQLTVYTSSGITNFNFFDFPVLTNISNQVLYQIEK